MLTHLNILYLYTDRFTTCQHRESDGPRHFGQVFGHPMGRVHRAVLRRTPNEASLNAVVDALRSASIVGGTGTPLPMRPEQGRTSGGIERRSNKET